VYDLIYLDKNNYFLRGCYTPVCCLRLTNIQHTINWFAVDKMTQAVVQAKQPNFQTLKRRIFTVQHRFYFFDITNKKKVIRV